MDEKNISRESQCRRAFLGRAFLGLGSIAAAGMLRSPSIANGPRIAPAAAAFTSVGNPRQIAARARRVIFLCMAGGPSQLELFDHKPKLAEMHGQPVPESVTKGQPIAQLQSQAKLQCFGPQATFSRFGKS